MLQSASQFWPLSLLLPGPYPETNKSSPHLHSLFSFKSTLILSSHLSLGFLSSLFYEYLFKENAIHVSPLAHALSSSLISSSLIFWSWCYLVENISMEYDITTPFLRPVCGIHSETRRWQIYLRRKKKIRVNVNKNAKLYSVRLTRADHSGRAVWGIKWLRSLERWDRGFESHSKHGCLCVGRGLATDWYTV
jgi:hypothetical protein